MTIQEIYTVELICQLIRQMRSKASFDFVNGNIIPPDINTTRRQRGLLKWTYSRSNLKPRSLENSIVKACNWLRMLGLIPQKIKNLSENASKYLIHNIAHMYLSNNTEVFNVYFWSPYRCLRHVFFFFFYRVALSFSYFLKKNRTRLFFGKYAGFQGEELNCRTEKLFFVHLAISIL